MATHPKYCFTDLSYQTHVVKQTPHSAAYATWLQKTMAEPIGGNVLFGTDFFMSCMETDIPSYWSAMASILGPDFDRATRVNSMQFLGFGPPSVPDADDELPLPGSSLERHARYLSGKAGGNPSFATGAPPAAWLTRQWALPPQPRLPGGPG